MVAFLVITSKIFIEDKKYKAVTIECANDTVSDIYKELKSSF